MKKLAFTLIALATALNLAACATIQSIGNVGPKKLRVYSITQTDFFSANRMLLVTDKKGNVVAATGGTVSGPGTVGLETAGTIATAGAVYYGAKAVQNGVDHANVNVHNVPSSFTVKGIPSSIDINGRIKK
jgi:hypothetical protein